MAEDPKKVEGEVAPPVEKVETPVGVIDVTRSTVEKELATELQEKEVEKQNLITRVDDLLEQIKEKDAAIEGKEIVDKTEYEGLQTELTEKKGQLHEIAQNVLKEEKAVLRTKMEAAGYTEEQLNEFDEKITDHVELQKMEWMFTQIGENMQTAIEERVQAALKEAGIEEKKKEEETQPDADNPPEGSQVTIEPPKVPSEGEFETYREMADDLYDRAREGDIKAERDLDRLWEMGAKRLKEDMDNVSIIGCPRCGTGILEGNICPGCGWDPEKYRLKGGEIY